MPIISAHDALPKGYRLGEFEILQVLGIGGFGIVYLAMDHALQRQVAIKEYMPAALAARGMASEVIVRSASHAETFALGLRSFINEARLLARFDHPSLVKVYRFWEAHGTAYMVMPYYRGQTLLQVRRAMDGPPDEAWLRRLITPLLGALECLHREDVFHRDVAPDNIMLLDEGAGAVNGRPVLLDLGAARRVIGDHTHALTAIVKPSFAPIEQYAETAQIRQGPWTDLYALAAVVHYCITGRPPMPATARAVHDELPSLGQMASGLADGLGCQFSDAFIHAIDHALAVRPQERPASIAVWRDALAGLAEPPANGLRAAGDPWAPQTVLVRPVAGETPAGHLTLDQHAFMTTVPAAGKLHAPPTWPEQQEALSAGHPEMAGATPARRPDQRQAAPTGVASSLMPSTMPAAHRAADVSAQHAAGLEDALANRVPVAAAQADEEFALHKTPIPPRQPTAPASGTTGHPSVVGEGSIAGRRPLAWVFVGLALMTVLAVWWQQRHAATPTGLPGADMAMAAEPASDKLGEGKAPGDANAQPTAPLAKLGSAEACNGDGSSSGSPAVAASSRKPRGPVKAERVVSLQDDGKVPEPSGPLNPRRACGGKTFIMLAICMKRHCSRPEYEAHPACERMRQQEAAQRTGANSY